MSNIDIARHAVRDILSKLYLIQGHQLMLGYGYYKTDKEIERIVRLRGRMRRYKNKFLVCPLRDRMIESLTK